MSLVPRVVDHLPHRHPRPPPAARPGLPHEERKAVSNDQPSEDDDPDEELEESAVPGGTATA